MKLERVSSAKISKWTIEHPVRYNSRGLYFQMGNNTTEKQVVSPQ